MWGYERLEAMDFASEVTSTVVGEVALPLHAPCSPELRARHGPELKRLALTARALPGLNKRTALGAGGGSSDGLVRIHVTGTAPG